MWKDLLCGCAKKGIQYSEEWNRKVAKDSGHHYRLPGDDCLFLDFDGHCQVEQRPDGSLEVLMDSASSSGGFPWVKIIGKIWGHMVVHLLTREP